MGATIGVGFDWRRARLPAGIIGEHRVNRFLIEQLAPAGYAAGGDFDRLPIPFRAVAGDLATGEPVVMAQGQQLFEWNGRVDREVQIVMRGNQVWTRKIGATEPDFARGRAMTDLPRQNGVVRVQVMQGRGDVSVIQQPNAQNSFTTIVRIQDPRSGQDTYRLVGFWEGWLLSKDANNLLTMLWTWQNGDISNNPIYNGDYPKALAGIKAKAIVMPASTDLYFPPEDSAIEVKHMPNAELRVVETYWGHFAGGPGTSPDDIKVLDAALKELLAS